MENNERCGFCWDKPAEADNPDHLCIGCQSLVDTCITCGDYIDIGLMECDDCEQFGEDLRRLLARDFEEYRARA